MARIMIRKEVLSYDNIIVEVPSDQFILGTDGKTQLAECPICHGETVNSNDDDCPVCNSVQNTRAHGIPGFISQERAKHLMTEYLPNTRIPDKLRVAQTIAHANFLHTFPSEKFEG